MLLVEVLIVSSSFKKIFVKPLLSSYVVSSHKLLLYSNKLNIGTC